MRYQNWDVLLFPGISKTPIQEFKTTCHVIQDSGKAHVAAVVWHGADVAFASWATLTDVAVSFGASSYARHLAIASNRYLVHTSSRAWYAFPIVYSFMGDTGT